MASFRGSAVFSAAVFFYALGLLFCIAGYVGPWLETPTPSHIESIGISKVCCQPSCTQAFIETANSKAVMFDDKCYDITKNSEKFQDFYPRSFVSPDWFRTIQDMHLACLILLPFTLFLILSFLVSFCCLQRQLKRRERPSSCMIISKCGFALWFILTLILGSLMIIEPVVFYHNYEDARTRGAFFHDSTYFMKYAAGFAITIASGVAFFISSILDMVVFCTILKKMIRLSRGDPKMVFADEFDELDPQATEMERLSHEDEPQNQVIVRPGYKDEPQDNNTVPVAAPRTKSLVDINDRSYQNIPSRPQDAQLTRREQTQDQGGLAYPDIPEQRNPGQPAGVPVPQKRKSLIMEKDKKGEGMVPVYGYSAAESDMSGPSTYAPSTHYSYNPRLESDTESFVRDDGRYRSKTRATAGQGFQPRSTDSPQIQHKVVDAKPADVKHSRYAAY